MPRARTPAIHPIELPTPFPVGPVNVFLVEADPLTLIDAGLDLPECRAALESGLAARGVAPTDIRRVVLSHGHVDHIGLAGWFQELGAEVWLHRLDFGKVFKEDWWLAGRDELMEAAGVPAGAREQMALGYELLLRLARPLHRPLRTMDAGDRIPFDRFDLEVLHTPGHCLGHVSLWWEAGRLLVGGDLLLHGISPNPLAEPLPGGGHAPTLRQFLDSLDAVAARPADRVLAGHGPAIDDHRAVIAGYQAHHAQRLAHTCAALPAGGATAWEMTRRLYPRISERSLFLALSEVLAHLDLLVSRGEARVDRGAGACRYFRGSA